MARCSTLEMFLAKLLGGYSSLCLRSQGTVPLVERLFDTSSKNIPLLLISTWFLVLFALSGVTCTANNQLRYAFIQSASSVSSDSLAIRNISIQLFPNVLAVEALHLRARRTPFNQTTNFLLEFLPFFQILQLGSSGTLIRDVFQDPLQLQRYPKTLVLPQCHQGLQTRSPVPLRKLFPIPLESAP